MKSFMYGALGSVGMLVGFGWIDAWLDGQQATATVWAMAITVAFVVAYLMFERAAQAG